MEDDCLTFIRRRGLRYETTGGQRPLRPNYGGVMNAACPQMRKTCGAGRNLPGNCSLDVRGPGAAPCCRLEDDLRQTVGIQGFPGRMNFHTASQNDEPEEYGAQGPSHEA